MMWVSGFGCQVSAPPLAADCMKLRLAGSQKEVEHRTSNIEHWTSNIE